MSRYESSRFVKDPKIMNKEVLRKACDKLGWKYVERGEDFLVTHLNRGEELYGEYALNPQITKKRMYFEAIEKVLPGVKIYIDASDGTTQKLLPLESFSGAGDGN